MKPLTRIDPHTQWIHADDLPTIVPHAPLRFDLDAGLSSADDQSFDRNGYGEEFDVFAATMSEAPPPLVRG